MSVEDNMLTLASKYNLEEGKTQDYYNLHGKWCLTKNGGEKIRIAEGITYTSPVITLGAVSVAYQATFTDKAGNIIHMNGSCRFDGTKNTPEKSHAPEMAWKRMETRGTIKILGLLAQGIYGDDEFDTDFKQGTQPAPQQAVAQTVSPSGQAYVGGEAMNIPPEGTEGWFTNAEKLPQDWANQMGRLCELTKQDRSKWEGKLIDNSGLFQKDDGSTWFPSAKYGGFNQIVFDVNTFNGQTKSKAKFAFKIYKMVRETLDTLEQNGSVEISVPNGNGGVQLEQILRHDQQPQLEAQPVAGQGVAPPVQPSPTFTPDDIPF